MKVLMSGTERVLVATGFLRIPTEGRWLSPVSATNESVMYNYQAAECQTMRLSAAMAA